jgi:subtilase family serine protease
MRHRGPIAAALVAVLLVIASLLVGAHAGSRSSGAADPASALSTDVVHLPAHSVVEDLPGTTSISLTLTLSNPRSSALTQFLEGVENPSSPGYRHFVTFPEFVDRFAPPASQTRSVEAALSAAGARSVSASPDGSIVSGILPAATVDRLFGVTLVSFGWSGGLHLYTAVGSPTLPGPLAGLVSGVSGLSNVPTAELAAESTAHIAPMHLFPTGRSQFIYDPALGVNWFVGSDFTQAYGATHLFPGAGSVAGATYPSSVAIATLLVSSYNSTLGINLPPWDPTVINTYLNSTLGPGWPMPSLAGIPVMAGGVTPPYPGSFGNNNDSTEYEVENSLDLEMAGSLAPGASLYNFYFAESLLESSSVTNGDAADYFAQALSQALAYSYAPAHLAVVSCSFGLPDLNDSAWSVELLTAAATGVTILSASGDQGNAPDSQTGRGDGQWPVWPASDATNLSGALSVGGVSLDFSGTPTSSYNGTVLNLSYDPHDGSLIDVSAWWDTEGGPGQYAGSEGGASSVFSEPWWQFHSAAQPAIVNATVLQGQKSLGRSGPDIAMPANSTIATIAADSSGNVYFTVLEGTSVASPVLAGLLADVVAVENNRSGGSSWTSLGFLDPEVYRIASFFTAFPASGGDPFVDVTTGANYVFSAAAGWDAVTGWGEVTAPAFLAVDENTTVRGYLYLGPTPTLPSGGSSGGGSIPWDLIFIIFGVGIAVAVLMVLLAARPRRPRSISTGVPSGAEWGGGGPPHLGMHTGGPGSTFLCPFCGAIRPSEPVRCPQCGAF